MKDKLLEEINTNEETIEQWLKYLVIFTLGMAAGIFLVILTVR